MAGRKIFASTNNKQQRRIGHKKKVPKEEKENSPRDRIDFEEEVRPQMIDIATSSTEQGIQSQKGKVIKMGNNDKQETDIFPENKAAPVKFDGK